MRALQEEENGEVMPASPSWLLVKGRNGHVTEEQRLVHISLQACEPITVVESQDLALINLLIALAATWKKNTRDEKCITHG